MQVCLGASIGFTPATDRFRRSVDAISPSLQISETCHGVSRPAHLTTGVKEAAMPPDRSQWRLSQTWWKRKRRFASSPPAAQFLVRRPLGKSAATLTINFHETGVEDRPSRCISQQMYRPRFILFRIGFRGANAIYLTVTTLPIQGRPGGSPLFMLRTGSNLGFERRSA